MALLDGFRTDIDQAAARYGVPVEWVRAVIMTESSGNPNAIRQEPRIGDASRGLMQLLLRTARGLGYVGTPEGLFDPTTNIDLGTKLIAQLRARKDVGSNFSRMYSAYNSGNPTLYLKSAQVAEHVRRAERWLQRIFAEQLRD